MSSEDNQEIVQAKMIEGVLYIEASAYQLALAKFEALSAEHEELYNMYDKLKAENHALRVSVNED